MKRAAYKKAWGSKDCRTGEKITVMPPTKKEMRSPHRRGSQMGGAVVLVKGNF